MLKQFQQIKAHRPLAVAVVLVTMLLVVPVIVVACGGSAGDGAKGSKQQPGALLTQSALSLPDVRLQALQASPEIASIRDLVDWKTAQLNTYYGIQEQAITAAVAGPDTPSRTLIAAFRPEAESLSFRTVLLEITAPEQEKASRSSTGGSFTGTATVFAPSGQMLSQATFENDRVMEVREGAATSRGVDWNCFKDCLRNTWRWLPGWLQGVCGAGCSGCLRGIWWSCPACAGCLGGYIVGCIRDCWR